jgi:predicted nucleic acid-binding protein
MILYVDTSALVKKYFEESYSAEVISAWKSALAISTSAVAYAELVAAVYRKGREARVKKSLIQTIMNVFQEDWSSLVIVEVDNRLNEMIHKIIVNHHLRGFDAIHLASALAVASAISDDFLFACYDEGLRRAAQAEGLNTMPQ